MSMHLDLAQWRAALLADAQDLVAKAVAGIRVAVAAQKDGAPVSLDWRMFNFIGDGVQVSDDPSRQRVNVYIPGAPAALSSPAASSSTAAKAKSLWVPAASGFGIWGFFNQHFTVTIPAGAEAIDFSVGYLNYDAHDFSVYQGAYAGPGVHGPNYYDAGPYPSPFRYTLDPLADMTQLTFITYSQYSFGGFWTGSGTWVFSGGGSGDANVSPPTDWTLLSYGDTLWGSAVGATGASGVPGGTGIWATSSPASATEQVLFRQHFTLDAGSVLDARLTINARDHINGVWINGTLLLPPQPSGTTQSVSISPSLLATGGADNVLAVWGDNAGPSADSPDLAWVSFALAVDLASHGTDTQYIPWSTITAKGDLIAGTGAAAGTAVPVGSDGKVLTADSGASDGVSWQTPAAGGMTNPMSAQDDVIVGGTGGTPTRVAKGSNNTVWGVNGSGVLGYKADPTGGSGNATSTGAAGSEPGSPVSGDLYLPNNGAVVERYSGSAWVPWGPIFPLIKPNLGDFSWVNQGGASAVTTNGGIHLIAPAGAGNSVRALVKSAPGTPYTITIALLPLLANIAFNFAGLCLRNSSTGELILYGHSGYAGHGGYEVQKYTNETTWSARYQTSSFHGHPLFLRFKDDGSTRYAQASWDGVNFYTAHSVGRTDFTTPNQVGFFAESNNAGFAAEMTVLHWG